MIKISSNTKRRDIPDHIKEGLAPFPVYQIKFMVCTFTFLMLDLVILLPLLFPVYKTVLFVTIPPMVFMSIWAVWLLLRKPENTEMESLLFLGYIGIVGSFCYFVLTMKYHYMSGIQTPIYYIAMFIVYLAMIYYFVRNEHKKYSSLKEKQAKQTPAWHYTVAAIGPGAGYIFAQYLMGLAPSMVLIIMSLVFFGISIVFMFILARGFHKYFFIKQNIQYATFHNKRLKKKYKMTKVGS
ncbi:hypothetical protein ACNRWW_02815 [Metabacillus sp. HB246100]